MAKVLKSSDLIRSIKRRAMIPTNQRTFTDADFLEMINEELNDGLLPHVLQVHEEFYVTYEDQAIQSDVERYPIPYRATGNKLRDVAYVDQVGQHFELGQITVDEISDFQRLYTTTNKNVFYIQNTDIVLPNNLYAGLGFLRSYYYIRPNTLVLETETGQIQSIDRVSGTIVLDNVPDSFTNLQEMDFIAQRSPSKIISFDKTPTSVNQVTKSIVFNPSDIPSDLIIGDYICLKEETPVPQLPVELHALLAQRVAVHCLEALGDTQGLANAQRKLQEMEVNTLKLIDSRVDGAPQKINQRNGTLVEAIGKRRTYKP